MAEIPVDPRASVKRHQERMRLYENLTPKALGDLPVLPASYWYLATPYSQWSPNLDTAYKEACRCAAAFMRVGFPVMSPIAHSHGIAIHGGIAAVNHEFWMSVYDPLIEMAGGLAMVMMDGWRESRGMAEEHDRFLVAGKPIELLTWPLE